MNNLVSFQGLKGMDRAGNPGAIVGAAVLGLAGVVMAGDASMPATEPVAD